MDEEKMKGQVVQQDNKSYTLQMNPEQDCSFFSAWATDNRSKWFRLMWDVNDKTLNGNFEHDFEAYPDD